MIRGIFLCFSLWLIAVPGWAVNKCIGPDGKVTYQEAACPNGKALNGNEKPPSHDQRSQDVMSPNDVARALDAQMSGDVLKQMDRNAQERKRQLADAKARPLVPREDGNVFVGMKRDQVLEAWGKPSSINETVRASGSSEQWVYRRGRYETQYVHLFNEVVTSVHTSRH